MIDNLIAQRIKDTVRIYDVVSQFYELKKAGTNYQCLCPFHEDHSLGSFSVNVRENYCFCFSCQKGGDAIEFLKLSQGMSYEEALKWLANYYSIEVREGERFTYKAMPIAPRPQTPSLPLLVIDKDEHLTRTLGKENTFTQWLRSLPWNESQTERVDKVLKNYFLGTTKDGRVIFWRINEKCECVNGKIMLYWRGGHRAKDAEGNSIGTNWTANMLCGCGKYDRNKYTIDTGIFGLHLINIQPKQVSIVESEKSALICSIVYGNAKDNLWLAIGGLTYLTKERLKPIIDRDIPIIVYPDMDGIDKWKKQADKIGYNRLTVADKWMRDNWREEDGPKADIADILIRLITPTMQKVIAEHPKLEAFAKALDLELINTTKLHG